MKGRIVGLSFGSARKVLFRPVQTQRHFPCSRVLLRCIKPLAGHLPEPLGLRLAHILCSDPLVKQKALRQLSVTIRFRELQISSTRSTALLTVSVTSATEGLGLLYRLIFLHSPISTLLPSPEIR